MSNDFAYRIATDREPVELHDFLGAAVQIADALGAPAQTVEVLGACTRLIDGVVAVEVVLRCPIVPAPTDETGHQA